MTSPTDIIGLFDKRYGLNIPYHQKAFLVNTLCLLIIFGDMLKDVSVTNPGSILKVEFDESSKQFLRFFEAIDACIKDSVIVLMFFHLTGHF